MVTSLGVGADEGDWLLVQTTEPNRSTAYATWVDGVPAKGGIAGRIEQARSSMFGASHVPVLVTITTPEAEHQVTAQRRAVAGELRALVDAQPGLGAQIERLSRAP